MPHPEIDNSSSFHYEPLWLADENGVPVLVSVIKAAYKIDGAKLVLADEQTPVDSSGTYWGNEGPSSYKYEPETAFVKLSTDVVLVAHAHAQERNAHFVDAGIKVGPLQKVVRVFGDRYWVKTGGQIIATKPQPFERLPLIYELAFGGWDMAAKDEKLWRYEARNPVGRSFGDPLRYVEEGRVPMPNIEDPNHLIKRYGDTPPPAGFGFIAPHWHPRTQFAGTYDEAWVKERKPLLPKDFDRRFFNAASPGLIAPGYLTGDEEVVIVNAAPVTPLRFRLPGVSPPVCRIELRDRTEILTTNLDTVIVNTDEMVVFLLWRGCVPVRRGPHDAVAIEVSGGPLATRPAIA